MTPHGNFGSRDRYSEIEARPQPERCLACHTQTVYDPERCVLCGRCVDVCPEQCLRLVPLEELELDVPGVVRLSTLFSISGETVLGAGGAALIKLLGTRAMVYGALITALSLWAALPIWIAGRALERRDI